MSGIDFTMMFTIHAAFRRELRRLADHPGGPDPLGWQLFTRFLHAHHTAEDAALWPLLDPHPLLTEMTAEHTALDPLVAAVDQALGAGADHRPAAAALRDGLTAHLRHEEEAALPLVDAALTPEQYAMFGAAHRDRIGDDVPTYLPWLLDELPPDRTAKVIAGLKPEIRTAYETGWRAAYEALTLWGPGA